MMNPPEWSKPFCWSTMNEPWTEADDVIEEIRQIRMQISARFDHDIHKYAAYLMERQKRHGDRLVDPATLRRRRSAGDPNTTQQESGWVQMERSDSAHSAVAGAEHERLPLGEDAVRQPETLETMLAGVG